MNYKEVEGIDENGNPTTFKIEIPTAKEQLKQIENSYRELKGKINNDPFIHFYEMLRFKAVEKALEALEIIEDNLKYGYVFIGYNKDNKPLFQFADTKLYEEIKKNEKH